MNKMLRSLLVVLMGFVFFLGNSMPTVITASDENTGETEKAGEVLPDEAPAEGSGEDTAVAEKADTKEPEETAGEVPVEGSGEDTALTEKADTKEPEETAGSDNNEPAETEPAGEQAVPAEETKKATEVPANTEVIEEQDTPAASGEPSETDGQSAEEDVEPSEEAEEPAEENREEGLLGAPEPITVSDWDMDTRGEYAYYKYIENTDIFSAADGSTLVYQMKVHPNRTDYYSVVQAMMNSYGRNNTNYYVADSMDTVLTDPDGNTLFSFHSLPSGNVEGRVVTPNEFIMEKDKEYLITVTFNGINPEYKKYARVSGQGSSGIWTAFYGGIERHHHYRDGKCICYDEFPVDSESNIPYSHIMYYLPCGDNGKPNFVYVATEDNKEKRIVVHASVKGGNIDIPSTTSDHLTYQPYYYSDYNDAPMTFADWNDPPYWDVTLWPDDQRYYPVTFRLSVNQSDYTLNEPKILSGKGQVKIGLGPTTYNSLYIPNYSDIGIYPILKWNKERDELDIGFTGTADDGTTHYGGYNYDTDTYDYVYKPLSFEHVKRESGKLMTRRWNYITGQYEFVESTSGSNYSAEHRIPYFISVILEKKPPIPEPVVEKFDVEMKNVTDDSATITIKGKLDRDLFDLKGNEEPYLTKITESLMLSVGTVKAKIGTQEVDEEGNFTITLANAPLDANIVLTTANDTSQKVYETIPVPLLQIPVKKIWTDAEGNTSDEITASHKDDKVTVTVYADGKETDRTKELSSTSDTPWEDVIRGLPEYTHYEKDGSPQTIKYTVKETAVNGYKAKYDDEKSSKYLELGAEVKDLIFSSKYILLSESAKMALTVVGDKVEVKPFDPDDEYQKWTTVGHTFRNVWVYSGDPSLIPGQGDEFGDFDAILIKNDKTGKYLAIKYEGPFLTDDPENDYIAGYVKSSVTDRAVIRTVGMYNRIQKRPVNYYDFQLEYYVSSFGIKPASAVFTPPTALFPDMRSGALRFIAPPWPFIALRWYDAGMSQSYVTSLASSVLADINVFDDSDGILYKVTNTPRTLTIEKKLIYSQTKAEKTVDNETFYFALFSDEARTQRIENIDIQQLTIKNASSNKVILEGLPNGTYYIGETDANGRLLEKGKLSDGTEFIPDYGDGFSFEVTDDSDSGVELTINNVIDKPTSGEVTVTKKLVDDETGGPVTVKGKYTVHAALFSDKECTVRVSGIQSITIDGNSSSSTTFKDIPEGTYYVAETDADGKKLNHGSLADVIGFKVEYSGNKVTVKSGGQASAEITNIFTTKKNPPAENPPRKTPPQSVPNTGDNTHINLWILMLMISTGAAINIFRMLRRSYRA